MAGYRRFARYKGRTIPSVGMLMLSRDDIIYDSNRNLTVGHHPFPGEIVVILNSYFSSKKVIENGKIIEKVYENYKILRNCKIQFCERLVEENEISDKNHGIVVGQSYYQLNPTEISAAVNDVNSEIKGHNLENTSKTIFSIILDSIPYIRAGKGIQEAVTGKNVVTGEDIGLFDRILSGISAIPFGNIIKVLVKVSKSIKGVKNAARVEKVINLLKKIDESKSGIEPTLKLKNTKDNIDSIIDALKEDMKEDE